MLPSALCRLRPDALAQSQPSHGCFAEHGTFPAQRRPCASTSTTTCDFRNRLWGNFAPGLSLKGRDQRTGLAGLTGRRDGRSRHSGGSVGSRSYRYHSRTLTARPISRSRACCLACSSVSLASGAAGAALTTSVRVQVGGRIRLQWTGKVCAPLRLHLPGYGVYARACVRSTSGRVDGCWPWSRRSAQRANSAQRG